MGKRSDKTNTGEGGKGKKGRTVSDDADELLGMSTTSMDFDVASVEGEDQLQAYIQVQQVTNDTDPLMWWKQHQ